jgi:hypothetical protein
MEADYVGKDPVNGVSFGISFKAAEKYAMENNLDIVFPKENEIQIDIDRKKDLKEYEDRLSFVQRFVSVTEIDRHKSKSGKGYHITLQLNATNKLNTIQDKILLQAVLCSDWKREFLSYVRVIQGNPHPTLFFEKKNKKVNKNVSKTI